jgi:hypothetical protein
MRRWSYVEPGDDGVTPVTVTMTDDDIIRDYYAWWKGEMERAGKTHLISEQHCIDDFVVVHWAQLVEEADGG